MSVVGVWRHILNLWYVCVCVVTGWKIAGTFVVVFCKCTDLSTFTVSVFTATSNRAAEPFATWSTIYCQILRESCAKF